jgi:beta-1,4-mannosyl-glycoprotein beta-1,4-N-acetylglucosaminyltransferase
MNENSWIYYADWFWYLGWYEHRFEVAQSCYLDAQLQPCTQGQAHFMRVALRKIVTTPNERMVAQAMQPQIRIPDDELDLTQVAGNQEDSAARVQVAERGSRGLASLPPVGVDHAASVRAPGAGQRPGSPRSLDTGARPSTYVFTNDWFEAQRPVVDKILSQFDTRQPLRILEIGSHEGRSTVHYLDHHLDHPESLIVSVDPFSTEDSTTPLTESTKSIFEHNVATSRFPEKSRLIVGYSQDVLCRLINQGETYDYIVVDGSHLAKDTLLDACLAFQLLRPGGVMFFDDYLGGGDDRDRNPHWPKIGIDSFLKSYEGNYSIVHKGYHLGLKKSGEAVAPAPRRIVDCFLFNNELDMLRLRLTELKEVVDVFVLVESRYTFSGKSKPLYFDDHKEEFSDFNIVHIVLDNQPDSNPWINEANQRNAPIQYLREAMDENDVALLCDLDEIPDPVIIGGIRNHQIPACTYFEMDLYYYNFNWLKKCKWTRASAVNRETIGKFSIEQIRNYQAGFNTVVRQAGWHLSYFLTPEQIREKIQAFSHQEFNQARFLDLQAIRSAIDSGTDLFGRGEEESLVAWSGERLPRSSALLEAVAP